MTTETLERHYKLFIDEVSPYNFFLGLNGYLDYVKSIPFLVSVMQETLKDRNKEYAVLDELENNAVKEVKLAKKRFFPCQGKNCAIARKKHTENWFLFIFAKRAYSLK